MCSCIKHREVTQRKFHDEATSVDLFIFLFDLHHPVANKRLYKTVGKIETIMESIEER